MRLHLPVEQPGEERAGAIRLVRRQPLRLQAVLLGRPLDHAAARHDLLREAGGRRLHIDDDGVLGVDQVVG